MAAIDAVPMSLRRVTEVFSKATGRKTSYGSGYHLGGGLVLTARHVLIPELSGDATAMSLEIRARPLAIAHESEFLLAEPVWPSREHLGDPDLPDVALIRIASLKDRGDMQYRSELGDADADTDEGSVEVRMVGFPAFRPKVGTRHDTEEVTGTVRPATGFVSRTYQIEDKTVQNQTALDTSLDWHGMSGAGLLAGGRVVGVVVVRKVGDRYDFAAVRVSALLAGDGVPTSLGDLVEIVGGASETPPPPALATLACLLGRDEQEDEFAGYHGRCQPQLADKLPPRAMICLLPGADRFEHCPTDLARRFAIKTLPELKWPKNQEFCWLDWPPRSFALADALAALKASMWNRLAPPSGAVPTDVEPYRQLLADATRPRLFVTDLTERTLDARAAELASEWSHFWAGLALPDGRPPVHLLLINAAHAEEARSWLAARGEHGHVVMEPLTHLGPCKPSDLERWLRNRVPVFLGAQHRELIERIGRDLSAEFGGSKFHMHDFKTRVAKLTSHG